jgi:uncharacterized protein (DUF1501 family)
MTFIYRRDWMRGVAAGLGGLSLSGWLPAFAEEVATNPARRRHCILLWMSGGPSQTDTFDMKPNHENGGEFKEIATNVPGMRFTEHLPKLAQHADQLAIVRSLRTKEGDHARGTHLMRTGQRPMGPITYPAISCSLAKALGSDDDVLPRCVSVAPYLALSREAFGPGFLGPRFTPLVVNAGSGGVPAAGATQGFTELKIESLQPVGSITPDQVKRRRELWSLLQKDFVNQHRGGAAAAQQTVYERSMNMMTAETAEAFDLSKEPAALREAYGRGVFGQGCLMARRLVERGVPVVEVSLSGSNGGGFGWDTHSNNFEALKPLLAELDSGWGTLMEDLKQRGLLESTTILWMGEFGRTPKINGTAGRDHFPGAWSCVFGGGGIAGGQAYGRTSEDGTKVEENPVDAADVLTTLVKAVGVDPRTENLSNTGRPIKLIEGEPIRGLLT